MTGVARPGGALSLAMLTYVADLDAVDAQMTAHVAWLEDGIRQGVLLVAGRRNPRTGGVLLFRGEKAAVEAVAATDPFVTSGVATVEVVEFSASLSMPGFADLL